VDDRDYEVGYGKPPRHHQFRKGTSGNPRGRPRKEVTIPALFQKIAQQKVRTNGHTGQEYMTKMEASITQLVNKSASGDMRAMKLLMQIATKFPDLIKDPASNLVKHTVVFVRAKDGRPDM